MHHPRGQMDLVMTNPYLEDASHDAVIIIYAHAINISTIKIIFAKITATTVHHIVRDVWPWCLRYL